MELPRLTRRSGRSTRRALSIRKRAEKQFALFSVNPGHPSLHLKQVGEFWSVRITQAYRALALRDGGQFTWIWIGTHQEYERLLR
jgi:hypothetical protein